MISQRRKCEIFTELHTRDDAWFIPNPWDLGSAALLERQGFEALATSSAALAQTLGLADGQVTLEQKLAHCALLAAGTGIPINVDFEDGYASSTHQLGENIRRLAQTGVAGCSIEDYSRTGGYVFERSEAVDRLQAAAEAVAGLGMPFVLTARAENLLRRHNDLDDTIERLRAYAAVGAQVLYAPGLKTEAEIRAVRDAVDRPLNVLAPFLPGVSLKALGAAGATRVSLGSALHNVALAALEQSVQRMRSEGRFP